MQINNFYRFYNLNRKKYSILENQSIADFRIDLHQSLNYFENI